MTLDIDVARLEATSTDRALLDDFLDVIIQDLTRTIDAAIGGDAGNPAHQIDGGSGQITFPLADEAGRVVAELGVARAALAEARLRAMPASIQDKPPFVSIIDSLAETPVTLVVQAGVVQLSLSEARDLDIGDAVVLDRSLNAPFDLLHASTSQPIGRVALIDTSDLHHLRLIAA